MSAAISESIWKAFIKKQDLPVKPDDKDLLKALARLDKTSERDLEARLEALNALAEEIPKQVMALGKLKKQLGDKPFGLVKDELYDILKQAEAMQKQTKAALEAEDDDDEDSAPNALVNPKLLFKQLSMCRKDPERTMKFAFVDAKGKEQPAMLALHPRISARALFGKLQAAAGVKTGAYGSAWVDGTDLMLQLDKPLSGLVKKVRPPVKACGFRIAKAVIWNADGTIFEQDDTPEDALEGQDAAAPAAANPSAPARPTAPPQPSATYEKKLAELMPRVEKARDGGDPDAPKHQALLDFAAGKAKAGDFMAAIAALRRLDEMLDKPASPAAGGGTVDLAAAFNARLAALLPQLKSAEQGLRLMASEAGAIARGSKDFQAANDVLDELERRLAQGDAKPAEPATASAPAGNASAPSKVAFTQARLDWDQMRKRVQAELRKVEAAVLDMCRDEADFSTIAANVKDVYSVLDHLDERLIDKLDEALNAEEAALRRRLHGEAQGIVREYGSFVREDEWLSAIDDNGFVDIALVSALTACLDGIDRQLAASLEA